LERGGKGGTATRGKQIDGNSVTLGFVLLLLLLDIRGACILFVSKGNENHRMVLPGGNEMRRCAAGKFNRPKARGNSI